MYPKLQMYIFNNNLALLSKSFAEDGYESDSSSTSLSSRGGAASDSLVERLKIGMYFGVWYALNVIYNSK